MFELIEKAMLTAMGAASLSQKKAEELLADMKERLNLSEDEGRALLQKLQETAKVNQAKLEELAQQEVEKACKRLGVVTADEFQKLRKKVSQLEKKLKSQ
ncbi:poly(hydroxyalkanoate) granule associated protein phasin [Geothermobacter ehrlichii]|uniref:Poly(Hydroxyalkanoate) granule associated protein phasin n=1 Tax=Geothermobacter ehrlichii TaxID=213224 RepID=A0A5D3WJ62_9BACT|nr:phasin family protein [Geothermobacter ehrlichii]TYO98305.1 poly(hydroxyalkanoate) granule associated protein phasin [Geothermobacter ehrlichii]